MATKSLLCAAAVIAGLMGCAPPRGLTAANCTGGHCDVDVYVDNCVINAPKIDNTGANNIDWNIKSSGYAFPDEAVHLGVWLKSPLSSGCASPNGVFDSPKRQSDTTFRLHNKGNPGTYCYGVQVVNTTTTPPTTCPDLDPQIVNH
jgi:hypothetical protein